MSVAKASLGKFLCCLPNFLPIFHQVNRCRNLTPYLADARGTVVTTPTEHSPVRVPPTMEIASACRRQRQKGSGLSRWGIKKSGQMGREGWGSCPLPEFRELVSLQITDLHIITT